MFDTANHPKLIFKSTPIERVDNKNFTVFYLYLPSKEGI